MNRRTITILTLLAVLTAAPAMAEPRPSSDLLLPYFEVDLSDPGGKTTLFAVGNAAEEAVTVRASVTTNWGIEVISAPFELAAGEVRTVNLRDWIVRGELPGRTLGDAELAHVQAALSGQVSPKDGMYYGTQPEPSVTDLAVGAMTLRVTSRPRHDALWGDYFWASPDEDFAEGELLVNIDRTTDCRGLCDLHRLRFLDGGGFDGGTELVIWSSRRGQPSPDANTLNTGTVLSLSAFHTEPGAKFDERELDLLPVQVLEVRDLLLDEDFGWLDIVTEQDVYVGVRYSAEQRYSVTLQSWCIPEPQDPPCQGNDCPDRGRPEIRIEKSTNGVDADEPFGPPMLEAGDAVTWEYVVTNTGRVVLNDVQVTDDQEGAIACPKSTLQPGESMTCTHGGQAPPEADIPGEGFFYANLATVTGTSETGSTVTDDDPSHYQVQKTLDPEPSVQIEKATNGQDADAGPGPELAEGAAVTWSYVVTNVGSDGLENLAVSDDKEGPVSCPKATLGVGESMTCTPKAGVAQVGQYVNTATVTGTGITSGKPATDDDPSHYHVPEIVDGSIDVEKATNGHDADAGPGPELSEGAAVTWTYVVTNDGPETVTGIAVTDDKEGAVVCPETSLEPGESMTCTPKHGVAQIGEYANVATVSGTGQDSGASVGDSDPSHYHVPEPECGDCEGKITRMELLYTGATCSTIEARATPEQRFGDPTAFGPSVVCPGQTFTVTGKPSSSPGFDGTLGTNLELFVDGAPNASIHTSCSQEVGPGFVAGSFTVVEAESQYGGPLCPLS